MSYVPGYGRSRRRTSYTGSGRTVRRGARRYQVPRGNLRKLHHHTSKRSLKHQVRTIQKQLKQDEATHTYRTVGAYEVCSAENSQGFASYAAFSSAVAESACTSLCYFDPSNPGVPLTANLNTGTYARDVSIQSSYASLEVRTAGTAPAEVTVYCCVPKADTSISPTTWFTNGLTDQGNPASSSVNMHLTDSALLRKNWRIVKSKRKTLQCGHKLVMKIGMPSYSFDPSLLDDHSFIYQKRWKSAVFVVFVNGCLAHTNAASVQGIQGACVDVMLKRKLVVRYDAGANFENYSVDDSELGAVVTATCVTGNKDSGVNQLYDRT